MKYFDKYCSFGEQDEAQQFEFDGTSLTVVKQDKEFPNSITDELKENNIVDAGYTNRSGYEVFDMDCLEVKEDDGKTLYIKFWNNGYSKFVSIEEKENNSYPHDDFCIVNIWESIFWPGAYNISHRDLRSTVGDVMLDIKVIGNTVHCTLYTHEWTLTSVGDDFQKVLTLALCTLYGCTSVIEFIEESDWGWDVDVITKEVERCL